MERAVRELKAPLRAQLCASGPTPPGEVQHWPECLAYELNHRPCRALQGRVACRVFQDARPVLRTYTLRKRREVFDEINALTWMFLQAQGVCTQDEADSIRRVAVEAWLQLHQVITVTQNHGVLPVFLKRTAHNYLGWPHSLRTELRGSAAAALTAAGVRRPRIVTHLGPAQPAAAA